MDKRRNTSESWIKIKERGKEISAIDGTNNYLLCYIIYNGERSGMVSNRGIVRNLGNERQL